MQLSFFDSCFLFGRPDTVAIKPVQGMASAGDEPPAVGEYAQKNKGILPLFFPALFFYVYNGIDAGVRFLQVFEAFNCFVSFSAFVRFFYYIFAEAVRKYAVNGDIICFFISAEWMLLK